MTILAFYKIDYGRHTYDDELHIDALKQLLSLDDEEVRFYAIDYDYNEIPQGSRLMSRDEFEVDYNDEILDNGGWWCKTLVIPTDDVNKILDTDFVF